MTQRNLENLTGISQSKLHRIEAGTRRMKMNELISIAAALEVPLGDLTGNSVPGRLVCTEPTANARSSRAMREELAYYFEVEDYLDRQAIPEPAGAPVTSTD